MCGGVACRETSITPPVQLTKLLKAPILLLTDLIFGMRHE
nr:Hypothetical protein [Providencia rettgeri]